MYRHPNTIDCSVQLNYLIKAVRNTNDAKEYIMMIIIIIIDLLHMPYKNIPMTKQDN